MRSCSTLVEGNWLTLNAVWGLSGWSISVADWFSGIKEALESVLGGSGISAAGRVYLDVPHWS